MAKSVNGNSNIVQLDRFQVDTRFSAVSEVESYWEGLRAGRLMPRRSDIDPRGIEQALECAFILERIAPGLARFRIAGSHLTDLLGMEVRGMPLGTFFEPADRRKINEALETVFDGPATVKIDLKSPRAIGKPEISARMVLLPLKSDLGDVARVLGCLSTRGEIGRTPRRFEVQAVDLRQIGAVFLDVQREEETLTPNVRLTEEVAAYLPPRPQATGKPHKTPYLRLVHSDA